MFTPARISEEEKCRVGVDLETERMPMPHTVSTMNHLDIVEVTDHDY